MIDLPELLYSTEQGKELDRRAADIPGYEEGRLMQLAGTASFRSIRALWPGTRSLAVCCGPFWVAVTRCLLRRLENILFPKDF